MSLTLTTQDQAILRTAAYGAVSLLAADAAGSPHKTATAGSLALWSATGPIGHVLAAKTKVVNLDGKSAAAIADHVLPALTEAMTLLTRQEPAEARNFRDTVLVAVDAAAQAGKGAPGPVMTEMIRKITAALDAAPAAQDRPEVQEAIQAFVDAGFAGVQVRVNDERGEWTGSAGVRKLGEAAKPSTEGHFRIGSATKTFTATLVLQLVADGTIGLDAPVDDYLPGYGLDRRITVRMLLQHTSGVFNFTGEYYEDGTFAPGIPGLGKEWVEENESRTYRPEELVRLALSKPARFEPGTGWSYANTNYVLARLLIEKVTGRSYGEQLRLRIAGPLGLSGTVVPEDSPEIPEPHAHGYYRYQDGEEWKTADTTRFNPTWISAAGDMISTTRDLQAFMSALLGGKLLPADLLAEMRKPDLTIGYGLGVFVEDIGDGVTLIHHNGNFWGWAALMYGTPDGSKTLIASVTTGEAEFDLPALGAAFEQAKQKLVQTVFGEKPAN
ncbi:serine hydrolase domain-containing protein [Nonomuraea typhae]|uniref:serine hydrolase domain-containing protein n=1 Tax=Nonomuraea typhae TaxID=2603600 RepID=UPI001FEB4627|nr:serine hydrolase domain-containing protein [Nonomuraea typhae]